MPLALILKYSQILLTLAFVWFLGSLTAVLFNQDLRVQQPSLSFEPAKSLNIPPVNNDSITLFGELPKTIAVKTPKSEIKQVTESTTIQPTKLNVKLIGLIQNQIGSVALIEKGRETLVLKVGEALQSGVLLKQVLETHVVIDNRGRFESLYLAGMDFKALESSASAPIHTLNAADKEKVLDLQQKLKTSPLSMNRYVRFKSITEGGKVVALKIWPRAERKVFEALGFRTGDIIHAIDGQPISVLMKSPKSWQSLLKKTQFSLELERSGSRQTLNVSLQ
jgi:general secretion pathway protein C